MFIRVSSPTDLVDIDASRIADKTQNGINLPRTSNHTTTTLPTLQREYLKRKQCHFHVSNQHKSESPDEDLHRRISRGFPTSEPIRIRQKKRQSVILSRRSQRYHENQELTSIMNNKKAHEHYRVMPYRELSTPARILKLDRRVSASEFPFPRVVSKRKRNHLIKSSSANLICDFRKTASKRAHTPLLSDKTANKVYRGYYTNKIETRNNFPTRPATHQSYKRVQLSHHCKYALRQNLKLYNFEKKLEAKRTTSGIQYEY